MQGLLETMDVFSASNELHSTLCEVFHRQCEQMFIVRYMLADGDTITVDVRKPYRTPEVDRFEIFCAGSGTIVASAGTLGRLRHTQHFKHHRELRKWMHTTVQPDATLQLVC
tara:strand:+ start:145 stop:480 length:336 start_codon:yes stop_codon:yes gene_type:complete